MVGVTAETKIIWGGGPPRRSNRHVGSVRSGLTGEAQLAQRALSVHLLGELTLLLMLLHGLGEPVGRASR